MRAFASLALALILAAGGPPALAQTFGVFGPAGQFKQMREADMLALPQTTAKLRRGGHGSGKEAVYEGVPLTSILRLVGTPAGARVHGDPTRLIVTVTGQDGYTAVLTLVETDAWFGKTPPIVAMTKNGGQGLGPEEGPWRLIVPDDSRPERAVRGVSEIKVFAVKIPEV
ncbi:MAG TPA: hypothetical protein VEA79_05105 [Phenylobacterium sp.]|nr:hypothetical protein [Phenylobacterium sp.]